MPTLSEASMVRVSSPPFQPSDVALPPVMRADGAELSAIVTNETLRDTRPRSGANGSPVPLLVQLLAKQRTRATICPALIGPDANGLRYAVFELKQLLPPGQAT